MNAATVVRPARSEAAWIRAATVTAAMVILLARPTIANTVGWSTPVVIAVFAGILALGLAAPVEVDSHGRSVSSKTSGSSKTTVAIVFGAGLLVFVAGRLLSAGHPPAPATGAVIALNTLAAVAEEAVFRRVAFAALLPAGPGCAIAGSALLFGLAHVTVYGWWAFPIDVAAGAVLGWQRWVSGSWAVPAATHAFADLLVVI